MKKIITTICLLAFMGASSQVLVNDYYELEFLPLESQETNNFKGSPFLNEKFLPGAIIIEGRDPIKVMLRYNVLKEEMEIKIDQEELEIFKLSRNQNTVYEILPFQYALYSVKHDGKEINGYFARGFQGEKYSLLIKPTVKVTEAQKAKGYGTDIPASIDISNEYFILFDDGRVENVRLKEKDIKKLFNSDKVKEYFKDNSLNSVEDLNSFLEFMETTEL